MSQDAPHFIYPVTPTALVKEEAKKLEELATLQQALNDLSSASVAEIEDAMTAMAGETRIPAHALRAVMKARTSNQAMAFLKVVANEEQTLRELHAVWQEAGFRPPLDAVKRNLLAGLKRMLRYMHKPFMGSPPALEPVEPGWSSLHPSLREFFGDDGARDVLAYLLGFGQGRGLLSSQPGGLWPLEWVIDRLIERQSGQSPAPSTVAETSALQSHEATSTIDVRIDLPTHIPLADLLVEPYKQARTVALPMVETSPLPPPAPVVASPLYKEEETLTPALAATPEPRMIPTPEGSQQPDAAVRCSRCLQKLQNGECPGQWVTIKIQKKKRVTEVLACDPGSYQNKQDNDRDIASAWHNFLKNKRRVPKVPELVEAMKTGSNLTKDTVYNWYDRTVEPREELRAEYQKIWQAGGLPHLP